MRNSRRKSNDRQTEERAYNDAVDFCENVNRLLGEYNNKKITIMKELSIEAKATLYDKAVSKLRRFMAQGVDPLITMADVQDFFPELKESKESEDERIRKAAIEFVRQNKSFNYCLGISKEEVIAWLEKQGELSICNTPSREVILSIWNLGNEWKELTNGCISTEYGTQLDYIQKHWQESEYYLKGKQGKQKPAAWSEDDEENLNWFEKFFRAESVIAEGKDIPQDRYLWFKNLKDRVQPKQKWSEGDDTFFKAIIRDIENTQYISEEAKKDRIDWFKSIKDRVQPQSQWKPSDKQMELLREVQQALLGKDCHKRFVDFMYELKRLRE